MASRANRSLVVSLCGRLGQVSRDAGKARPVGVIIDVAGDGGQCAAELGWCLGLVRGGERDEQAVVDLGVEDGWRPATSVDSDHTRITGHRRNPDGDEVPEVRRRL